MQFRSMVMLASGLLCLPAWADDRQEKIDLLNALNRQCEQARAAKLAPIREQLVQDCVKDPRASMQDCRGLYSHHGEPNINRMRGSFIQGLFYDLPECQNAEKAWRAWEASQPWRR